MIDGLEYAQILAPGRVAEQPAPVFPEIGFIQTHEIADVHCVRRDHVLSPSRSQSSTPFMYKKPIRGSSNRKVGVSSVLNNSSRKCLYGCRRALLMMFRMVLLGRM